MQPAIAALLVGLLLALGAVAPVAAAARVPKVALIVGPVGDLTSRYRSLANEAAVVAKAAGAEVVKAYSPNATWPAVKAAISGASIVVYLGHGNGWPSRYRSALFPPTQNGFGLNPVAGVDDHAHQYFGEASVDNVQLAKNAIVVLSHLCYASGNTEPGLAEGTVDQAVQRVDNYAAGFIRAGAAAVVAEGHMGPAWYVRQLLTSKASIESIWNRSPEAHGNVMRSASVRSRGFSARLDPDNATSGFYRSLVSRGVTADALRSSAVGTVTTQSAGPPPIPSLAQSAIKFGTLKLGSLPIAATQTHVSIPLAAGVASSIPKGAEVSLRWDPILLDQQPAPPASIVQPAGSPAPVASPSPSGSPAASASPAGSGSPAASLSPSGSPAASSSPSPAPSAASSPSASPAPTASPSPSPSVGPAQTPTVAHGMFQLPRSSAAPDPTPDTAPVLVIPSEAPAVDLVVPERQGSVVEPVKAKIAADGLTVGVTFPTAPGLYRLVPTLHTPSGVAYDPATQALLTPVIVRVGGKIAVAYGAPGSLTLAAGRDATVPIRVLNSGSEAWDVSVTLQPGQAGTSYHTSQFSAVLTATWVSTTAAPVPAASSAELDGAIAGPGGSVSLALGVTAPEAPGEYLLLLDTISPSRGPLSALGSAPAIIRVTVADAGPVPTVVPPQRND